MLTTADLTQIAQENWYYQIELADGITTNGRPRANAAVYRDYLKRIELSGLSCLDIGTQEFVAPVLMLRQGAKKVVGYDRLSLETRCNAIKQVYEVDFDYVSGTSLNNLKATLSSRGLPVTYDFVNFAGVLYHMVDPLAGMAMARSFLRQGGLMLMETSVKRSNDFILEFNNAGHLYEGSNYFQVSIATLDYWIRMLRMKTLDCAWWGGKDVCRFLVICSATGQTDPDTDDDWMGKGFISQDLKPYGLDFKELTSSEPVVGYTPIEGPHRVYRKNGSLDLFETAAKQRRYDENISLRALKLSDRY